MTIAINLSKTLAIFFAFATVTVLGKKTISMILHLLSPVSYCN
ncbi:MAG: hypothetical protein BROFUL_02184 [Candidatus Brocadia fulgida]|jgi:hypothetical protein|uniref:Uncharacterized protein n=1 Tax=Candidatus Brocadia fulgida TaxID=380242 RepID=A0A0M2UTG7_9BACT|nr:MAG: hypothetical protein BROFUL_02184 [Candidatus Brocadia fulgida]